MKDRHFTHKWQEIKRLIRRYHSFAIITHENPDGDGIGSATALIELLLRLGKKVKFFTETSIPTKFDYLNGSDDFHQFYLSDTYLEMVQVIIVLDTNSKARLGSLVHLIENTCAMICCIDHHPLRPDSVTDCVATDINACCTGELIYRLFKDFGRKLNQRAAKGLYTSIICDTGSFAHSRSSITAHKITEECIVAGINPDEIYRKVFETIPKEQFMMFVCGFQKMEMHFDSKIIVIKICKKDWEQLGLQQKHVEAFDFEEFHAFNKRMEEVHAVILLFEIQENKVRLSMRSKKNFDVESLAKKFSGGGHKQASGAQFMGTLEEAHQKVLAYMESELLTKG